MNAEATENPMGDRMVRIPQVADHLAIHRTSVYRLIRQGHLPTVTVGAEIRIPASAVREYTRRTLRFRGR